MIEISGRSFAPPRRPTIVLCVDGCGPDYLDRALADGAMPRLRRALDAGGLYARGLGQMPSFTNPNNASIVTGQPASVHGISGNYYFDRELGREVAMNEPRFLRVPTIFEKMTDAGVRTLCVTAKDKLRGLLGARHPSSSGGVAPASFSAERAHEQRVDDVLVTDLVGRKNPSIYDPSISHYAMEMGLALGDRLGAELLYVSLTDYVQHKDAPGGAMASSFYARLDELLGVYLDRGFVVGLTADHGMNDKTNDDGSPNVRFLDDALEEAGVEGARVLLPITDPYVAHHGALGSYATIYVDERDLRRARAAIEDLEGVERVLDRDRAADELELPADRIGDLVVLADCRTVLGKSAASHDLREVTRGLRSHGGLHEREVPIILLAELRVETRRAIGGGRPLQNRDVFDLVLNGVV